MMLSMHPQRGKTVSAPGSLIPGIFIHPGIGAFFMKKLISLLLAAAMLLSLLAGCSGKQEAAAVPETAAPENEPEVQEIPQVTPTIFEEITGIPQDKTVMTVGSTEVPAELYFYWVCYVCGSMEYNILRDYQNYGMYSSCVRAETMTVDWSSSYSGLPLMKYALSQAEATIKYHMAVEELAAEKNVGLTEVNRADMEKDLRRTMDEMGGAKEFADYLKMLGVSAANLERISASEYLYNNLLDLVFDESSDLYLTEDGYDNYAAYADHILLATQDMRTGEQVNPNKLLEKYNLAKDLLEQLENAEDPVALFAELADTYSDDPGRAQNPTGYIYTPGTMVGEFESAVQELEPGQISGLVESDYGFHIILRRDLKEALRNDPEQKEPIAREYLNKFLVDKRTASKVEQDPCLSEIDWENFYSAYTAKVDAIAATENT